MAADIPLDISEAQRARDAARPGRAAWRATVYLLQLTALTATYYAAGRIGLSVPISRGYMMAFRPSAGVALAGLLLCGYRVWPGILLGSILVNAGIAIDPAGQVMATRPLTAAAWIGLGATLHALVAAFLILRWVRSVKLLDRAAYAYMWWTWWMGDLVGVLLVPPLLLAWSRRPRLSEPPWNTARARLSVELLSVFTLAVLGVSLILVRDDHYPLSFVLFPCLMWLAFRFDRGTVTLVTFLLSVVEIHGTLQNIGPISRATSHQSTLLLQYFLGIAALTGLTLAAALSDRKQAEEELQKAHADLERRVAERTEALAQANRALQEEVARRTHAEANQQRLLRQLVTAQEEERRRLARELHDQMGQSLTGLMLGLQAVKDSSGPGDPAQGRLQQLLDLTNEIGREIHHIAWELRPTALDDHGLHKTLMRHVEDWAELSRIEIDFHCAGLDGGRLPSHLETALYRIIQELLTNVAKHARARRVSLILERGPHQVLAIVEDDGCGFDADAVLQAYGGDRGLGLLGVSERVAQVGGTFQVESAPGRGTTLYVRIPLTVDGKETPDDEIAHPVGR